MKLKKGLKGLKRQYARRQSVKKIPVVKTLEKGALTTGIFYTFIGWKSIDLILQEYVCTGMVSDFPL